MTFVRKEPTFSKPDQHKSPPIRTEGDRSSDLPTPNNGKSAGYGGWLFCLAVCLALLWLVRSSREYSAEESVIKQSGLSLTASQKMRIESLASGQPPRQATTRGPNPVIEFAIVCEDLATVELLVTTITEARTDRWVSALTKGQSDLVRAPAVEPRLAAFGCIEIKAGTLVDVYSASPAPVVGTLAFVGVTHPAMLDYRSR